MTDNEGTGGSSREDRDRGGARGPRRGSGSGSAAGGSGTGRGGFGGRSGGSRSSDSRGGRKDESGEAGRRSSGGRGRGGAGPRSQDRSRGPDRGRDQRAGSPAGRGQRPDSPRRESAERDPDLPEGVVLADLPRAIKAELRGLPPDMADKVGLRLIAAGQLLDVDPEGAYAQAKVARRLAARLPVVRAAVAECAYGAGDYQAALTDYRALRRMTGDDEYLPVMADCERALGRPQEALKLAKEAFGLGLDPVSAIEMRMVEAGARADLGQLAEALRLLAHEIETSQRVRDLNDTSKARLRYAYADQLLAQGDRRTARDWFLAAAKLDREGLTDAEERVAELDGMVIEFDDTEDVEEQPENGDETDRQ